MGSPYDEAARELSQAVDHLRNARRVVETNLAKVFWFNIGNAVTQIELLGEELIRRDGRTTRGKLRWQPQKSLKRDGPTR